MPQNGGTQAVMEENYDEDGMRRVQWAQRKERMQREKRKQMMIRKVSRVALPAAGVILAVLVGIAVKNGGRKEGVEASAAGQEGNGAAGMENGDGTDAKKRGESQPGVREGGQSQGGQADGEEGSAAGGSEAGGKDSAAGGSEAGGGEDSAAGGDKAGGGEDGGAGGSQTGTGESGAGGQTGAGTGGPFAATKLSGEYQTTGETVSAGNDVASSYAILVDVDEGNILMRRDEKSRMNPASMTKVLTLLVAAEHIDNLDDTFTITSEITDYCYVNDCSVAGFEKGDVMTIRDLMYGTILPSGADAALGLAIYVSGSQEAFVELMNEKLEELGLADTAHFTNCMGIYDENHYCTAYDMAVIMENALNNDLCREVMSTRTYTTGPTKRFPNGIDLSNWFLRRIEDKDCGGDVPGGKTGYVAQSQHCAVSYGIDKNGKRYVCVTGNAASKWYCINDHAYMYKRYME